MKRNVAFTLKTIRTLCRISALVSLAVASRLTAQGREGATEEALRSFRQSLTVFPSDNAPGLYMPATAGQSVSVYVPVVCLVRQNQPKKCDFDLPRPIQDVVVTFAFAAVPDLVEAQEVAKKLSLRADVKADQHYLVVALPGPGRAGICSNSFGSGASSGGTTTTMRLPVGLECQWSVAVGVRTGGPEGGFRIVWSDTASVTFVAREH